MMELTTLPSIWSALGSSLLQFLWQGAVIGLIAALVLELLGKGRASVRYLVCCGALASCVLAFVVTFSISLVTAIPFSGAKEAIFQLPDPLFGEIGEVTPSVSWFENLLSVETIAWFWVLGVLAMTLRLAHQWRWSHRLKTCCVYQPDERWLQVFQTLRKEFGVDRSVRLLSSSLANVPMVVGWLQPVVLIPVAAFSALTPEQLRVVLAHELSHIRRHDHIVNFFQCVIETLLFFHPVIWWLSKQIRSEREFCCDEASVGAVNDPRILAEALLSLESSRVDTSHSFLSSQGGPLMQRIYKILGRDQDSHSRYSENLAFACFLSGLLVALFAIPASGDAKSVAVSPVSVEFSVGQDSDSDRRPQDDDDDDDDDKQEALSARYKELQKRVKADVESGRLSAEDAEKMLIEARKKMFGDPKNEDPQKKDDPSDGIRRRIEEASRRIEEASRRIEEAIDAGEITAEQGRERLEELRKRLAATRDRAASRNGDGADEDVQRRLREAGRKIREGVAAGKITQEEGRARYEELRKRITARKARAVEKPQQARPKKKRSIDGAGVRKRLEAAIETGAMTWEQARDRYIEVMEQDDRGRGELIRARLEKGIEAGKITEDQAVEIYIEMMEEGQQDSEEQGSGEKKETRQKAVTRQDYAEAQAKMEKMVEAGEITAEQMQQRLAGMRKLIGRPSEKAETRQRTVTRQDYADAQAKMEQMVQDGEITAEQMQQRLAGMRKMIGRPSEKEETRQRTVTRQDYADAQAKMEQMVKDGKITAEQMQQRLASMRKLIGD